MKKNYLSYLNYNNNIKQFTSFSYTNVLTIFKQKIEYSLVVTQKAVTKVIVHPKELFWNKKKKALESFLIGKI